MIGEESVQGLALIEETAEVIEKGEALDHTPLTIQEIVRRAGTEDIRETKRTRSTKRIRSTSLESL